jgi:hypothetical protein
MSTVHKHCMSTVHRHCMSTVHRHCMSTVHRHCMSTVHRFYKLVSNAPTQRFATACDISQSVTTVTLLLKCYSPIKAIYYGRAMAQAVSRRPLTAESRVGSRVGPCRICGEQSGTGTGFSPSTSVFPCQFHSTGATLLVKMKKN